MEWQRIRKRAEDYVRSNLRDYDACARTFSWARARALLDGLPDGALNIAPEAIDRHLLAASFVPRPTQLGKQPRMEQAR